MQYTDLLQKAFSTAWKYKYLWVLGFFADLTSFLSYTGKLRQRVPHDFWRDLADPSQLGLWFGLSLFLVFLILIVVLAFLIIERIAEGGLIANAARIRRGESHTLTTAWNAGLQYFLRMVGLRLLQIVVVFVYVIVFAGFMIFVGVGIGGPVLLLSLLFVVPLFFAGIFFMAIIFSYAERFIVVENRGVFESVGEGLELLKREFGKSVAMGLIALGIMICLAIAVIILFVILALPLVGLCFLGSFPAILYGVFVLLPPAVLITAYLGVYRSCLWTFFFMELRGPAAGAAQAVEPSSPPPPVAE